MPKVSVIMPVYNSEKYISASVNSVINQTYSDWELIIIDDCSSDKSLEIIDGLKNDKFKILKNDKNLGPAMSRNKGIEIATR